MCMLLPCLYLYYLEGYYWSTPVRMYYYYSMYDTTSRQFRRSLKSVTYTTVVGHQPTTLQWIGFSDEQRRRDVGLSWPA